MWCLSSGYGIIENCCKMLAVTAVAFTVLSALHVKYFDFYFEYKNMTFKTKFYKVVYEIQCSFSRRSFLLLVFSLQFS